jgi:hypothetical protein
MEAEWLFHHLSEGAFESGSSQNSVLCVVETAGSVFFGRLAFGAEPESAKIS